MSTAKKEVIIVGGGASGIFAAIFARKNNAKVTILERNPRIGKKILATGNGRCNYTNINADVNHYYGKNPKFVYSSFANFSVQDTIDFFEQLGIAHKVEDAGKVFPMSDQAGSVLDVLRYELEEIGVNVITEAFVTKIVKRKNKFELYANDKVYKADSVVITTGGKAMPASGSDGNGFNLLKDLGHSVTDIFPGLVQLKLEGNYFKQIQGVKVKGLAELISKNKVLYDDKGDILFTSYGISGPPILQISRKAGELLLKEKEATLKISIIDRMNKEELFEYMIKRFKHMPKKTIEFSLVGLVNKRLIPVILKEIGITDLKTPVQNISHSMIDKLVNILVDWRFKIVGTNPFKDAQVTAGGISTKEINQKTLESKIIPGLFLAGEIIDIDGECGGYNLQWAWSSGFVAGNNASL